MTYDPIDANDDGVVDADVDNQSVSTEELRGDWDTLVTSGDDLAATLSNLSDDEVVQLTAGTHEISSWLDIDGVVGPTIRGVENATTVKVANGANVGGFRVGSSATVSDLTFKDIQFNGNADNQDQTVTRLHGWIFEDATDCEVINCYGTRTSPHHEVLSNPDDAHNSGGTVFTCRSQATNIEFIDCETEDPGDRGMQLAGSGHYVRGLKTRDGFDRSISLDVLLPDSSWDGADDVTIVDGDFANNTDGSCIGTAQYGASDCVVRDCKMRGTYRSAVKFGNSNCSNNIVEGNHAVHTGADSNVPAIRVNNGSQANDNVVIERNSTTPWSSLLTLQGDASGDGNTLIYEVSDGSSRISLTLAGDGATASDNTVVGSGDGPAALLSGQNATLKDGKIDAAGNHGVSVQASDVTVEGIEINNFGAGGGLAGIYIDSGLSGVRLAANEGETSNSPRAWIFPKSSVVLERNYLKSNVTAYDFSVATPEMVADNYPRPALSTPPTSPSEGDEYLDDGTNTGSGTTGIRIYLGGAWVDDVTA